MRVAFVIDLEFAPKIKWFKSMKLWWMHCLALIGWNWDKDYVTIEHRTEPNSVNIKSILMAINCSIDTVCDYLDRFKSDMAESKVHFTWICYVACQFPFDRASATKPYQIAVFICATDNQRLKTSNQRWSNFNPNTYIQIWGWLLIWW